MKKFKQFKSEQQYVAEVGPYASAFMAAAGLVGLGTAGFRLFKKTKEKFKGYKETKREKEENKESGVFIDQKVFNPETGQMDTETIPLHEPGSSKAAMSNDDIRKEQKKKQLGQDAINKAAKYKFVQAQKDNKDAIDAGGVLKYNKNTGKYSVEKPPKEDEPETTPPPEDQDQDPVGDGKSDAKAAKKEPEPKPEDEPKDEPKDKPEDEPKGSGMETAADYEGKDVKSIPDNLKDAVQNLERKKLKSTKDVEAHMKRWGLERVVGFSKKMGPSKMPSDYEYVKNSRIISFGKFISEGVMDDLKKVSKSKKDSEISLDDGSDIPIDPLTSQILVKYIEGLSSSEKNRTIQQIQRTERAFMKVLGKAHEG